jgi:hypothetical protein
VRSITLRGRYISGKAADVLVQRLLGMALDGDVADNTALQAIIGALDRAGLSVKHAVEIGPAKPYEVVFGDLAGGSRAESRSRQGISDADARQLELNLGVDAASDTDALEGEIVDAEPVEPESHPLSDLRPQPIRRYPPVEHCAGMAVIEEAARVRRVEAARYLQKQLPAPRSIYGCPDSTRTARRPQ